MIDDLSKLKIYSIGIVAENKEVGQDTCFIMPIEITPFVDGELTDEVVTVTEEGKDKNNEQYTVTVDTSAAVEAVWLRIYHTNRRTSPDVRKGERVLLYRYADSQDLYWDSMGMDDHLRKLETVAWTWSATEEEYQAVNSTEKDYRYSLELSTHKKLITLKTTKANEEPFAYTIQLDTGNGNFVITDDVGNYIQIDSMETIMTFINKEKTMVELNKQDILMYAPRDLNCKVDRDMLIEVGRNLSMMVDGKTLLDTKIESLFKVGGSTIKLTPSAIDVNCDTLNFN